MDIFKLAIEKPVTIIVGILLVLLFGTISIISLPVQLAPDTELPKVDVFTSWPGATPDEVESDVIERQERVLRSTQGLIKLESSSYNDYGRITLTFGLDVSIDTAVLRVSNKLDEVRAYPENIERPRISSTGANSKFIVIMNLLKTDGNSKDVVKYHTFFINDVVPLLERVPGVGNMVFFGGTSDQLEIVIDPVKMARNKLTINTVISKVVAANDDISAGTIGIDRKNYRIRTSSKFKNVNDPLDIVVFDDGVQRIFLKDIATTRIGWATQFASIMEKDVDACFLGIRRQQGANVLELTRNIKKVVDELNDGILKDKGLYLKWQHSEAPYILKSIDIMIWNVSIGAALAIAVLMMFLRSVRSTFVSALAIPISAIGAFIFLLLSNRNINVVSLAGISFAVGMLVDNSIVVIENIDRHRSMAKPITKAIIDGTKEVIGAVVASSLTTVAVFFPVIFIKEEAGQLFKDIAIAISAAILLSLVVSMTVIPTGMSLLFKKNEDKKQAGLGIVDKFGSAFNGFIMYSLDFFQKNIITRMGCVVFFTTISLGITWATMPKAEYLPQGNQNILFNVLVPPPGYSVEKRRELGNYVNEKIAPYLKEHNYNGVPQLATSMWTATDFFTMFSVKAVDKYETEIRKAIPTMIEIINSIPDMAGISIQPGLFESEFAKGRTIDVNVSATNMNQIVKAAGMIMATVRDVLPDAQIRPVPSLEIAYPEVNIVPNKSKLAAVGLTEYDFGIYIDVLLDGRKVSDYRPGGAREIDVVVRTEENYFATPEDILNCIIVDGFGNLIRVGDVASAQYTQGMTQIDHLERNRTVRLEISPPENIPLQAAMETIAEAIKNLREKGLLDEIGITQGGTADKLTQTMDTLKWNFILALIITYLLMSALFENFAYPFIIMFTVPLASAGGFLGLKAVNFLIAPQPMDVLTMLGFVILVGTVVNNAILIVHQALNNVRFEGMAHMEAIRESVRTRIRPIFISAATTIFGLAPLVLATGSGSEMYRGIGSVLLGGLTLSTFLSLFVIPALMAFFIKLEKIENRNQ